MKPTLAKGLPPKLFGRFAQPDSEPGRLSWWDLIPTIPYLFIFIIIPMATMAILGDLDAAVELDPDQGDWGLEFGLNAVLFIAFLLAIAPIVGKSFIRSFRVFTHHAFAWLKLLAIPVLWVVTIVLNFIINVSLLAATGEEPEQSVNQLGVEAMIAAVPIWAALLIFGLIGPFVEEYFFRHLLVGKLSVHLNIWVCAAISVVVFAAIHVMTELFTASGVEIVIALAGYLTMSIVFTLTYIFSGRSLVFVWLLHAFNNVVAVLLLYFFGPVLDPSGTVLSFFSAGSVA